MFVVARSCIIVITNGALGSIQLDTGREHLVTVVCHVQSFLIVNAVDMRSPCPVTFDGKCVRFRCLVVMTVLRDGRFLNRVELKVLYVIQAVFLFGFVLSQNHSIVFVSERNPSRVGARGRFLSRPRMDVRVRPGVMLQGNDGAIN